LQLQTKPKKKKKKKSTHHIFKTQEVAFQLNDDEDIRFVLDH